MITKNIFYPILLVSAVGVTGADAQVPPPPPLPGQDALAQRLKTSLESNDSNTYFSLLSDGVKVYDDATLVADDKAKWKALFAKRLSTKGVVFKVKNMFASTGRIAFVEQFNSAGSWPAGTRAECCWSTDMTTYLIRDGKVVTILRSKGGEEIK